MSRRCELGRDYFVRARSDPGYLTDLRAKRYEEPHRFFLDNAASLARPDLESLLDRVDSLDGCTRELLAMKEISDRDLPDFDLDPLLEAGAADSYVSVAHLLGFYVNVLGSWEDGVRLARAVGARIDLLPPTRSSARLLEASAQALAVGADDRAAREVWGRALELMPPGYDRFFLLLRIATTELKRFHDRRRAEEAIRLAGPEARALPRRGHGAADLVFAESLLRNLMALEAVMDGNLREAGDLMERAWADMQALKRDALTLESAVSTRYMLMVLENRALLCVRSDDLHAAAAILSQALVFARAEAADSLSEVLCLAAVVDLRLGKASAARRLSEKAVALLLADSRPGAFEMACKIQALACAELGDEIAAADWLRRAPAHRQAAGCQPTLVGRAI